jgi:UDP-N-acetylenolpyruvoylglucosamine reductase
MNLQDFYSKSEIVKSWNNTIKSKAIVLYPKNISQLKRLIIILKKKNKNYLIRTGSCSYDSKSINPDIKTFIISLRNLNKVLKINKNKKFIEVEAGALIADVIKSIKNKYLTLFSVPGGNKITIGGAISANTIGKDSSATIPSFGDSLIALEVLTNSGKIKTVKRNNDNLNKYVGAFGMAGIILKATLKVKNIKSQNLLVTTKILKDIKSIKNDLKKKSDYHYIQIDPFFRKEHFAISFRGNSTNFQKNIYKNISLKSFKFEEFFFKFFGFFINFFTWKLFYKLFFFINNRMKKFQDIHNFHYGSKYKHLIPLVCKNGLLDYEVLIKKNFTHIIKNLIIFLKKNKIHPIYIIVKKIYKSKRNYCYKFNDNGYAVAISINKSAIKTDILKLLKKFIKKNKLQINLSKTDEQFINKKNNSNDLFLSLYKKMLLKHHGISRTRTRSI